MSIDSSPCRPGGSGFLTTKQAADYLNLGVSTLARWRVEGKGPQYALMGSAVRYRKADLDAWATDNIRRSTSENSYLEAGK